MVDYDQLADQYKRFRRPDPRISSILRSHLKGAQTVLNLGAGIGSYEPAGYNVVAVDPSTEMIAQRKASTTKLVRGSAENCPFRKNTFDASMAILTIHHWSDIRQGLAEMMRVTRTRVILLTWIGYGESFWLEEYIPEIRSIEEPLFPSLNEIEEIVGPITVEPVQIPHDCTDGFMCAYWRRPQAYLDPGVRRAISTFARIHDCQEGLGHLEKDLTNGAWEKKYGHLLSKHSMDYGYRIVVREIET